MKPKTESEEIPDKAPSELPENPQLSGSIPETPAEGKTDYLSGGEDDQAL